jgi:hypothetical protein
VGFGLGRSKILYLSMGIDWLPLRHIRCTLHTNEIPRTDPLVQVDYVRVVDLDIGASKSDICAIRVVTISERAGRTRACNCGSVQTGMENIESPVVRRLIAKEQHQGWGFESFPRDQSYDLCTQIYDLSRFQHLVALSSGRLPRRRLSRRCSARTQARHLDGERRIKRVDDGASNRELVFVGSIRIPINMP